MVQIHDLVRYCDELLGPAAFSDYSPNGLQVEGRSGVERLITGVTASQRFLDAAIDAGADAVLVHHGYFWKGEDPRVTGMKGRRLGRLMRADVSLLAYHLPLDAHAELGNNVQLARRLGLEVRDRVDAAGLPGLLAMCEAPEPVAADAFTARIAELLARDPVHVDGGGASLRRVAVCTGAGQRFLAQAAALGADALVSGEISEPTAHEARELGIHYFAAGHHATERFGVQALGATIAHAFGIEHAYVEIDNPA